MKFGTDIHVAKRMNPNDFSDPLNVHVEPPAAQRFHISSEISQHLLNGLAQNVFMVPRVHHQQGNI